MLVGPSKCLEQIINNIIGRGWAKYREAKCWGKQLMCELDTDKSRYFVITEFNNCFIIILITEFVFFNEHPWAIFMQ